MSGAESRTRVKVCGLTRESDVAWACQCGADWLGFIVLGDSPRRIAPEHAAALVALAGERVTVGVMVSPTLSEALELVRLTRVSRIQLHGVEAASWPSDFPVECHFAVGVDEHGALTSPLPPSAHLVHLDTMSAGREGGTGRTFPWSAAEPVARRRRVVLAGGLGPDNVAQAIAAVRPFAVDASSRLEANPGGPGIKDPERVRRFIDAVREQDERLAQH